MDRNRAYIMIITTCIASLSARRAWIEIGGLGGVAPQGCVALRKESVDRNFQVRIVARGLLQSLSARRAWIEIFSMYN